MKGDKEFNKMVEEKISRKEAIKKTGLVAASAATMMILMKSQKAQACSPTVNRKDCQYDGYNQYSGGSGCWGSSNNSGYSSGGGSWGSGNNQQSGGSWNPGGGSHRR